MAIIRPTVPPIYQPTLAEIVAVNQIGRLPWEPESAGSRDFLLDYSSSSATFTRASEAAASDPSAGYAWYDLSTPWPTANVRRLLSSGIIIEGARTNAIIQSQNLTTGWSGGALISNNIDTSPDGSVTADRLTVNGNTVTPNDGARRYNSAGLPAGTYAVSLFTKLGTQGSSAYVQTVNGNNAGLAIALAANWTRTLKYSSLLTAFVELFANTTGQGPGGGVSGDNAVIWGVQAELSGVYPTTPIRTTGVAAARAAEHLSFPAGTWNTKISTGVWEIWILPQAANAQATDNPVVMSLNGATTYIQLVGGATGAVWMVIGGASTNRSATWPACTWLRLRIDHVQRLVTLLDGFLTGQGSFAFPAGTWGTGGALDIGKFAGTNHFNGIVGRPYAV